jgi:hypothetical protein
MSRHLTGDDAIAKGLDNYRRAAVKTGFKPAPQRSDGMLVYRNWSLETNFVHGEGRVILTQDRSRGDRERTRRVELRVTDKVGAKDAAESLSHVLNSPVPPEIVHLV